MKTTLNILNIDSNHWSFQVLFENNSDIIATLPVDSISRNGARIGLCFRLDQIEIDPIEITIISPKSIIPDVPLGPNKSITINFLANIEKKGEEAFALSFENATYKILKGMEYQVSFIWHDTKTSAIAWMPLII